MKFQSRNRGSFDFKHKGGVFRCYLQDQFQSRNRGSFDFKRTAFGHGDPNEQRVFRSRNRGSFGFKCKPSGTPTTPSNSSGFNLAIEVLLISSIQKSSGESFLAKVLFQSRNRDSFNFKLLITFPISTCLVLFQSRNRDSFNFKPIRRSVALTRLIECFNLAIEILLISSWFGNA